MVKKTRSSAKPPKSSRPPIITVMGHIDHGKTTLLDALRQANVAAKESGGITQHIGAYQIDHQGRKLTFIDTPGHAAFAAMRSRGAKVTDLAILVIDAVEGVKPQTKESLDHIKSAKAPFLVALNKIDLPNADLDKVKAQLGKIDVSVEGYGGDIVVAPISAKTKKGLSSLLEMTLLLTDMQKLVGDPKASLQAVVIESSLDHRRGPLATLIVKSGTLKVGDTLQVENITGKVKAMFDDSGKSLNQVVPGQPAQVLGFKQVPPVGSPVTQKGTGAKPSEEKPDLNQDVKDSKETKDAKNIKIILKADTAGTLEAITQNLSDEIILISSSVGNVSESNVLLAQSTGANIVSFRVKTTSSAKKLADIEKVTITSFNLIHELLDDLQKQALKLLEPTIDEDILGEAKIIAEFTVKGSRIAGCEITSGKFTKGNQLHLVRGKNQLADTKIKSIYQGKEEIDVAKKGEQCGVAFSSQLDFNLKDQLISFKKQT